jgi:hypothetical protein
MSDEDVMRLSLKQTYPSLTSERFERLFQKQITDRFMLSEAFDEEDTELGKELLKSEADKVREKLITDQKKFMEPAAAVVSQRKAAEEAAQKQLELDSQFKTLVTESAFAKSLLESKKVAVKMGDANVNVEVDPQTLIDATLDSDKFFSLFSDGKGGIDFEFWGEVVAYATNRNGFKEALGGHGKSEGTEKIIKKDLKNSTIVVKGKPGNNGTPEDFRAKLLKAFEAKGK